MKVLLIDPKNVKHYENYGKRENHEYLKNLESKKPIIFIKIMKIIENREIMRIMKIIENHENHFKHEKS